jgi:hypothetical protein
MGLLLRQMVPLSVLYLEHFVFVVRIRNPTHGSLVSLGTLRGLPIRRSGQRHVCVDTCIRDNRSRVYKTNQAIWIKLRGMLFSLEAHRVKEKILLHDLDN